MTRITHDTYRVSTTNPYMIHGFIPWRMSLFIPWFMIHHGYIWYLHMDIKIYYIMCHASWTVRNKTRQCQRQLFDIFVTWRFRSECWIELVYYWIYMATTDNSHLIHHMDPSRIRYEISYNSFIIWILQEWIMKIQISDWMEEFS